MNLKLSDFTPEDLARIEAYEKAQRDKKEAANRAFWAADAEKQRLRKEQEEARLAEMSPAMLRRGKDYFGWLSGQLLIGCFLGWHPLTMAIWFVIATLMAINYAFKYEDGFATLWLTFLVGVAVVWGLLL